MKRLIVVIALATVLLSSCTVISMAEDSYLYDHLGTHETYTCDWIDGIENIKDIQSAIYDHVTYKKGGKGHDTQSPEETCRLGTGNCSDKSVLMMSILYTNFNIKSNLVAVKYDDCKSIASGGIDVDHAIVECDDIYYEATESYYKVYTDVDVCYRYTFDELFPEVE